jgi:hypothetical protein
VVERLSTCPAVSVVEANPLTGSVLIRHTGPFSKIATFAGEGKIFIVTADIVSPITVTNRAAANLAWLEEQFTQLSGGRLDLRSAILIGLLALSVAQITRGEIMAPAVTLLWYAVQLIGVDKPITPPTSKDSP